MLPRQAMDNCSNVCLCLLVLSTLFPSTTGEITEISFPQFSVNDTSLKEFGDVQYNPDNHSWIMNARSAATSRPTCAALMYNGNLIPRIQDTAAGTVGAFNTSFTFKYITPPNEEIWDVNLTASKIATNFCFSILAYDQQRIQQPDSYMQYVSDYIGQPGPCTLSDLVSDFFMVCFDPDYNYNTGDRSNSLIYIVSGGNLVRNWRVWSRYNLCDNNRTHCSYLSDTGSFTAWIDFTPERAFQVRLVNGSSPHVDKPLLPLFQYPNFQLPAFLGDNVQLMFLASSSENHIQAHEITSWNFSSILVAKPVSPSPRRKWVHSTIYGTIGVVLALVIIGFLFLWLRRHYHFSSVSYTSALYEFSFRELCKATKNFNQKEKLGSGGFGTIYKGVVKKFGVETLVAIKRISYESLHAEATFLAEISSLSQVRHGNIVRLQGWCHEKDRLLLVYDYMPNGSLNQWLHDSGHSNGGSKESLPLKLRHDILEGVALAVEYLHKDCPQCVLHRDIKSSNVMLDADFKAHLGDFGLARLMDHKKLDKTTMAAGTIGYMAPEVAHTGKATKESDVYSFGVLVLEVVCGRRPLDFKEEEVDLFVPRHGNHVLLYNVWQAHGGGSLLSIADPRVLCTHPSRVSVEPSPGESEHGELGKFVNGTQVYPSAASFFNNMNGNTNVGSNIGTIEIESHESMMMENLLHLGLLCCLPDPKSRPTMGQVVRILEQIGDIENANYAHIRLSMPPLPDAIPIEMYPSVQFSHLIESKSQSSFL